MLCWIVASDPSIFWEVWQLYSIAEAYCGKSKGGMSLFPGEGGTLTFLKGKD